MGQKLQYALLVGLVVVTVLLAFLANRHVHATPPASDISSAPGADDATATPTPTVPASTPSKQVEFDFRASGVMALSIADDGSIVFATRGMCSGSAKSIELSTSIDGGKEISTSTSELTTALAVRTSGKRDLRVVGQDENCKIAEMVSTDGGSTWKAKRTVDLWYPDPDNSERVVSPEGVSSPKCTVVSLSQVTAESARVACADGTIKGSGDSGDTWTELGRLDNLRTATFLTPSDGYALARYNGCAANAFTTTDGGSTWTSGGCISGEPAQAIAATSSQLAAIVSKQFYVSTNSGNAWTQP